MKTTPTVLLLTDSLAFPRSEPEVVRYEETWVALLKHRFPGVDIVHCGRGGATIVDLFKHSAYYHGTIQPTLVLVQSGIVDCAPRALSIIEQQVLQRLPILGSPLLALARENAALLRRWRRMSYTPLPTYQAWTERYERVFANVHWIGILPAHPDYESRVQGIGAAIGRYNAILRQRNFIPTDDFTALDIMSDHHHLNSAGHRRLAERLACVVQDALSKGRPSAEAAPSAALSLEGEDR